MILLTAFLVLLPVPATQSGPPPPTQPPGGMVVVGERPPTAPPASAIPVLPTDARRLVDEYLQSLLQQLQNLADAYAANQRPDDAAALKAQIKLLQKAAGLGEDNMPSADRGVTVAMASYRDRVGETFVFTITGSADKPVWGTGVYTDDTSLEGAAVHAGVLRSGQTGPVRVTVLAGQQRYVGTKKNGVTSNDFGPFNGSFRIETGSGSASRPTSIQNFRGRLGETVTVPVVGASGAVWGSDVYTDDSSLGAAAVHAGILSPGEFGFVRVTMLGGLPSYPAVTRNGIVGQAYGEWQGSMKVERAPLPWVILLPDDVVDGTGMVQLPQMRKQIGVSFSVQTVGATGTVRGSGSVHR
jgi:hypothetical protein